MNQTLAMIHTGPVVIPPLKALAEKHLPGVRTVNLLDDKIVGDIGDSETVPQSVKNRLVYLGRCAAEAGADLILFTCSSVSQVAADVAEQVGIPVLRIDEAMADEAVSRGTRIAVIATLPTTLNPTCALIEERAALASVPVELTRRLCGEAFDLVSRGDGEGHDRVVGAAIEELAATHDVIVLAQASMARAAEKISVDTPVLSSPELGMLRTKSTLEKLGNEVRA